jgi:MFS family permease
MLISSQWYTKSESAPRFSFWYLGLGLGQVIGGLVSYGFQHMGQTSRLAGWRTMFVTLGLVTVLVGASVILFLPDSPMKAKWLSDKEKVALLKHVSVNKTGVENRKFRAKEILEALMDPQLYLLLLSVVLVRTAPLRGLPARVLTQFSFRCQVVWLPRTPPLSSATWATPRRKLPS